MASDILDTLQGPTADGKPGFHAFPSTIATPTGTNRALPLSTP